MHQTLANADSVLLISLYKPVFFIALLTLWFKVLAYLDKDLMALRLRRHSINAGLASVLMLAVLLWVYVIPLFWVGFPVAVLLMVGSVTGYGFYRNTQVDHNDQKWTGKSVLELFKRKPAFTKAKEVKIQKRGITLLNKDGTAIAKPAKDDPLLPTHELLEHLMEYALPRHAERIDIAVTAQKSAVSVLIDGVRYPQPALEPTAAVALIDYLKMHAKLDVADRRKKQQGMLYLIAVGIGKHTLAVATHGSTRDLVLSLTDDHGAKMITLDHAGLLDTQRAALKESMAKANGIYIVASPARQGMTTTLYGLLKEHDPYTQSIVTLEDQIANEMEGVKHTLIEPGTDGEAIAQKAAGIFRRDPQVLMLAKLADQKVAQVFAPAGEDVRIYFGLQLDDAMTATRAWVKAVGDGPQAAENLRAVIAQRLVRKLCTTCRVPFKPDPAVLKKLNLPDKVQQLYKNSGQVMLRDKPEMCPDCLGIGYRGRIGVFEVMIFDDAARKLIAESQFDQLRLHLRKQRTLMLQEAALARAVEGVTSISEITRVLTKEEPGKPPSSESGAPPAAPVA
jgi:type II secretory ATPase GspE/PulE/Tfp pilus assembly ATPase PilB-like protein